MKRYNKIILCLLPTMLLTSCGSKTIKLNYVESDLEFAKYNSIDSGLEKKDLKFDESSKFFKGECFLNSCISNDFFVNKDESTNKYGIVSSVTSDYIVEPTLTKEELRNYEAKYNILTIYEGDNTKIIASSGDVLYEGKRARYVSSYESKDKYYEIRTDDGDLVCSGIIKNNKHIKDKTPVDRNIFYSNKYGLNLTRYGLEGYSKKVVDTSYEIYKDGKLFKSYEVGKDYLAYYGRCEICIDGVEFSPYLVNEGEKPYCIKLDLLTGKKTKYFTNGFSFTLDCTLKDENGIYKYAIGNFKEDNKFKSAIVDKDFNVYRKFDFPVSRRQQAYIKYNDKYLSRSFQTLYDSKYNVIKTFMRENKQILNPALNLVFSLNYGDKQEKYSLYDFDGNPFKDITYNNGGSFMGTKGLWYMDGSTLNTLTNIDPETLMVGTEEQVEGLTYIGDTDTAVLFENENKEKIIMTPDYELNLIEGLKDYTFNEMYVTSNNGALIEFKEGFYNLKLK